MTARQDALDDLMDRRTAEWALRGSTNPGSFDAACLESTPRLDWWSLILLARRYVELPT